MKSLRLILSVLLVLFLVFALSVVGLAQEENEKTEITIAGGSVGIELELTKKAARMFEEEHPNVKVDVYTTPDLSDDRKGLYLQYLETKDSTIDVFQVDVIWPGELADHFLDLNEFGAQEVADKHFESIIQNNTVDGRLVAMPWFTDAGLLYYRTDLLNKYGYSEPPATWTELEEMAKTIQAGEREENPDFWGYVWQGNAYEGLTCNALEWIYSNNGGRIINEDKEVTINNKNAVETINMAADWVGEISPPGVTGLVEESSRKMFEAGNAAFMRNWPYVYALASEEDKATAGKFDVAPLPAGENGSSSAVLGGWNLAVNKYSEYPELAAELAIFMTSEKVQKMRAVEGSFNPTIADLYEDQDVLEANPFFGDLYQVFTNTVPRPSAEAGEDYSAVSERFFQAVHSVLTGESRAEDAIAYLELGIEDILED
ncbi:trehalose/maltose transport system substrate-binding protein [Halanaerobium congolense]|jgi:trehalose/maltose transport system substrate-binding protein|uniref:Trehalose/maltose transport system substrate-binding protein n=1 Tax=Halanaerobium congolense TaxID=54121 RepID=A0A1M7JNL4_9FIRM|nr:ABC transporter substrate-binding protein [Halanaerobium congolense]OEG61969.1 MAG: ABC transporter substrate-binding protein [Halanaerobium sp. MDAL1]PUU93464.1 MAG: Maltose/maltodextrin ABC transporter, substrate binding periplasmic protein MalE [Halanaerobium sp.]TDS31593.1 trehalose/maltose transport system substrate-binding protein [Halanaerobium congolense]TDX46695.1 trehalose/maltose transport system substrate-binding protein [Halanaerobium congolense]SDI31385.1 trehalose/maltose tra